jgi:hypothetical protein
VIAPIVERVGSFDVVRDDLFPGGTKARYIERLFDDAGEVVYASPVEGGAQFALATVAKILGKQATIFCAKRKEKHPRSLQVKALGAKVYQIAPGYLSVCQARARDYCNATGAKLAPFGMDVPGAAETIAEAARMIEIMPPAHVWCAGGSGVLARGLRLAWPAAQLHVVQVGKAISCHIPFAEVLRAREHFEDAVPNPDFPSDPHYDAKAWRIMKERAEPGSLFWNVAAPAGTGEIECR